MRQILNVSLPQEMLLEMRHVAKEAHFSMSELIRHLWRERNTAQLKRELSEAEKRFAEGNGIRAESMAKLLQDGNSL